MADHTPNNQPRLFGPTRVRHVTVCHFFTGVGVVSKYIDAAHVLAPLRKYAQQTFFVLVCDEKQKPISIIRHSLGSVTHYPIDVGIVAGSICATPGAAEVWFARNAPDGCTDISSKDREVASKLAHLIHGSGVESRGLLVIAPQGLASYFDGFREIPFQIDPHIRRNPVPVKERKIFRRRS